MNGCHVDQISATKFQRARAHQIKFITEIKKHNSATEKQLHSCTNTHTMTTTGVLTRNEIENETVPMCVCHHQRQQRKNYENYLSNFLSQTKAIETLLRATIAMNIWQNRTNLSVHRAQFECVRELLLWQNGNGNKMK